MSNRVAMAVAAVAVAGALLFASSASASTEFGDNCTATSATPPNFTLMQLSDAPGGALPLTAPTSGVITKWKVNLSSEATVSLAQQLKVFRSTPNPKQFQVVGEGIPASVHAGANSFDTRIPVQTGDRLGLFGSATGLPVGGLYCKTESVGDLIVGIEGNPAPGSIATIKEEGSKGRTAVSAVLEADADQDGFGDETQDLCPQSAAFQTTCPMVTLDAFSVVGAGAVSVLVATSNDAPVKVSGTVKLGQAGKAKLTASTKTVKAGKITNFKLKFPAKLKAKLKELEPGQKLQLKITASATDVAGNLSTDKLKVKLKGQG